MDEEYADTEYETPVDTGSDWSVPAPTHVSAMPMLPPAGAATFQGPPQATMQSAWGPFPPGAFPQAAIEPAAVGTVEESHNLGLSMLVPGIGGFLGLAYGGGFGAIAGIAFGGAAVNVYRAVRAGTAATEEANKEAIVSGTYAALGVAFASWVLWHRSKAAKNPVEMVEEP